MYLPELEVDWRRYPQLADNIWHAQMAGHPKVLTYDGPDLVTRSAQRKAAMHYTEGSTDYEIPPILSRDEYPFACTREGGGGSWVGHIPGRQNSAQGGMIAAFLKRHYIRPGTRFSVKVTNHPRGPVK